MVTPELTYGDILSAVLSALAPLLAFAFGYFTVEIRWHRKLRDEVYQPLREGIKAKKYLLKKKFKPASSLALDDSEHQDEVDEAEGIISKRGYQVDEHFAKRWKEIKDLEEEFQAIEEDLKEKFENEIKEDFIQYFVNSTNKDVVEDFGPSTNGEIVSFTNTQKIEDWWPVTQRWKPGLYILTGEILGTQEKAFEEMNKQLENLSPNTPQELCDDLKSIITDYREGQEVNKLKGKLLDEMDQLQDDIENYFLKGLPRKYWYYLVNFFNP